MPRDLPEFTTMCQRIDEDLRYNKQARSLKPTVPRAKDSMNSTYTPKYDSSARSKNPTHDPMDLDAVRTHSYAPVGSDERKNRAAKGECFGCGKKGYIQRDCPTHLFEKVRHNSFSSTNHAHSTRTTTSSNRSPPS